jgi:PEP-CTERM motif
MMSKNSDRKERKREDDNKRWITYAVTAGAFVTTGQADATIMYFNPFPDLVATDTDIESPGGQQQININFAATVVDPKAGTVEYSSSASVGGAAAPGANQLVLRTADLENDRDPKTGDNYQIAKGGAAGVLGGVNIRAALGLSAGDLIGSSLDWGVGTIDKDGNQGQGLAAGDDRYLGFRFDPATGKGPSAFNYGWANYAYEERTGGSGLARVTLYDYALETTENAGIRAGAGRPEPIPEPSTMTLLAIGAPGVLALRRRRLARAKARQAA